MSGRRIVEICNKKGLHARAAAKFVKCASAFPQKITVRNLDMPQDAVTEVDAKSILGLMMLGAAKGHRIEMICQDQPCCEPLDALEALIASCFGENE